MSEPSYPTDRSKMPLHERDPRPMPKDHQVARGVRPAKFWVYGAGGHGRELAEAAGLTDFLTDETLDLIQEGDTFVVGIGDPATRRACAAKGRALGMKYGSVSAAGAYLQDSVTHGEGCVFMPGAVVMANTKIGEGVLVNIGALVGHDCVLDDYCSIQPGAKLTGRVFVGAGAYVGIGAILICRGKKPLRIGPRAVIGGGAIVFEDVPEGATIVGVNRRVR